MRLSVLLVLSCLITLSGCASQRTIPTGAAGETFPHAAVAADHPVASQAGAEILRKGGNAVDAAVATSFALSVVRAGSCGIGGGGFMIICFNNDRVHGNRRIALNYRETAPAAVDADYFEFADALASRRGTMSIGVPGTVAGLIYALERYGTLDRATVLAPAIRAAENGFIVDEGYIDANRDLIEWYRQDASRQQRFSFVWKRFLNEGRLHVGDRILVPGQADALRLIAEQGLAAFYRGPIGMEILAAVRREGGPLRVEDLLQYQVAEVQPLMFEAFDHTFLTMPPPSSGGVALAQTLGILQIRLAELSRRHNDADYIHLVVESLKHAFADRARWQGDPAFVEVPVGDLLSPSYLSELASRIDLKQTRKLEDYGSIPPDDSGTSHFCVIDARGNAVAGTETINLEFGSLVPVERYGFCLNDQLDDFTTRTGESNAFGLRQSRRNRPAPGKRPLSSMTPTIVLDSRGRPCIVAGGSGGPRIISSTVQALLNVLLFDMPASRAVAERRFHHQWMPDVLELEPTWFPEAPPELIADLDSRGHRVEAGRHKGIVQLIRRGRGKRGWDAACDPRRGGRPDGF